MKVLTCPRCDKYVRFKHVVGTLHVCVTDCDLAGQHVGGWVEEEFGHLWWRRAERRCRKCHELLETRRER